MEQEGIMMCCGMEPISGIRHLESVHQDEQKAYYIRCRSCGRMEYERFTDATWPEAKEKAREKWNRMPAQDTKVDRCICCGEPIPEGRCVCWRCEHEGGKNDG